MCSSSSVQESISIKEGGLFTYNLYQAITGNRNFEKLYIDSDYTRNYFIKKYGQK